MRLRSQVTGEDVWSSAAHSSAVGPVERITTFFLLSLFFPFNFYWDLLLLDPGNWRWLRIGELMPPGFLGASWGESKGMLNAGSSVLSQCLQRRPLITWEKIIMPSRTGDTVSSLRQDIFMSQAKPVELQEGETSCHPHPWTLTHSLGLYQVLTKCQALG